MVEFPLLSYLVTIRDEIEEKIVNDEEEGRWL
jgi:hypothetical protein